MSVYVNFKESEAVDFLQRSGYAVLSYEIVKERHIHGSRFMEVEEKVTEAVKNGQSFSLSDAMSKELKSIIK